MSWLILAKGVIKSALTVVDKGVKKISLPSLVGSTIEIATTSLCDKIECIELYRWNYCFDTEQLLAPSLLMLELVSNLQIFRLRQI